LKAIVERGEEVDLVRLDIEAFPVDVAGTETYLGKVVVAFAYLERTERFHPRVVDLENRNREIVAIPVDHHLVVRIEVGTSRREDLEKQAAKQSKRPSRTQGFEIRRRIGRGYVG
jgi:hypothetical protein